MTRRTTAHVTFVRHLGDERGYTIKVTQKEIEINGGTYDGAYGPVEINRSQLPQLLDDIRNAVDSLPSEAQEVVRDMLARCPEVQHAEDAP